MILGTLLVLLFLWLFTTNTGKAVCLKLLQFACFVVVWLWCPIFIIYGVFFL